MYFCKDFSETLEAFAQTEIIIGQEKNNLSGRISNSQETFKNGDITF